MPERDEQVAVAIQAVLDYLAMHPHAGDSDEGIAQWWLPMMNVILPIDVVQQALDLLVAQRLLLCITLPDGRCLYLGRGPAASEPSERH